MSQEGGEWSIRVLPFSGKTSDWKIWSRNFLARANRKGYKDLLLGKEAIPKESEYTLAAGEANDAEKKTVKNWNLNEHAFEEILLSIEGQTKAGKVAFNLVDNCTTADQPDGNAKLAWDRLVNKYAPQTAPSYITLKKEFANSKLADSTENPDEWITDLECLRTEMNKVTISGKSDMTDVDVIIHILSNLPEEYEVQVNELEERLQDASTVVPIEDVRTKLNARYARIQKAEEARAEDKALAAFRKQFKGLCNKCGEYGHKAGDPICKESGQNNGGGGAGGRSQNNQGGDQSRRINGNCHYCGKYGHAKADCRKRKRDLAKKADEQANTAKDGAAGEYDDESIVELGLSGVDRLADAETDPSADEIAVADHHDEQPNASAEMVEATGIEPPTTKSEKSISRNADEHALKCKIDGIAYPSFTDRTMFGDSGCSCTLVNSMAGMYDVETIKEAIGGVGDDVIATRKGKLRCLVKQADGSSTQRVLSPVKYCENAREGLLSITNEMSNGATLGSDGTNNIVLRYPDGDTIVFDRRIKTRDGWVAGVEVIPLTDETAKLGEEKSKKVAAAGSTKMQSIDVNVLHEMLGHPCEATTRATGKLMNKKVTGTFKPCENCLLGKAKRAKISKAPQKSSTVPGGRISLDISSPKPKSIGGKHHWLLVVDECTDFCWSYFLKKKSELKDRVIELFKELKNKHGVTVKTVRLDNSGENNAFEQACKQEGLGIKFEYTAPGTPQQNGRVERKFQTLYGRVRAILLSSGVNGTLRKRLWAEAANTATDLENILYKQGKNGSSFQQFFGKGVKSLVPSSIQKFGEMAVITDQGKIKAKLDDRGKTCIWLGYAKDHAIGTHRIYNPKTKAVILSRNVVFLRKSLRECSLGNDVSEKQQVQLPTTIEDDDSDDVPIPPLARMISDDESTGNTEENEMGEDFETPSENVDDDELEVVPSPVTTVNHKVINAMKKLSASYNPEADKVIDRITRGNTNIETGRDTTVVETANFLMDIGMIAKENHNDPEEPTSFQEAYNHPDPVQRKKWREAIKKELRDMIKRGVWRQIKRRDVPYNRRCVKNKWVFKIKRNGIFRARLVACGYSQIPGVDYSSNYSPVVHDITFRVLILAIMLFKLSAKIVDVETAFLHGDLEEEIYMECPEGLEGANKQEDALLLRRCTYGLVQAARQYHKKAVEVLRKIGFVGGDVDPCLYMRRNKFGIVFIAIYVDDNLMVGHPAAIEDAIEGMKQNGFILKVEDNLNDYLSCEIKFSNDQKQAWLGQPHLVSNLNKTFGEMVKGKRTYKTPGTPQLNMVRNTDETQAISVKEQSLYRSGVGMLLWLVKHSRPDIANPVRELSKCLDGATSASYREMLRVIKYVLDTRDMGLKMIPTSDRNGPWDLVCYSDSDYASDPETRRSVSGYILYVRGVPVAWRSKAQRSVTLSSTEAEWIALSEAVKEIIFVLQLLESMQIEVELPIVVRVDNVGAIFMSDNKTTTSRAKHVDIRTKYVNEYCEDGKIKIIFVKSADNDSDILTKNLGGDLFDKHSTKLVMQQ